MPSPMPSQAERARSFRALHERSGAFVLPTAWDIGTARLLAELGFEALATTSAGYAFSIGGRDGCVGRDAMLAHAAALAAATGLPLSADLENGFGDAPENAAETIRLAAAGLVGGSIEDATGRREAPLYERALAAERVKRLSLGSALARAALGGFLRAAREIRARGTFGFVDQAATSREIADMLAPWADAAPR